MGNATVEAESTLTGARPPWEASDRCDTVAPDLRAYYEDGGRRFRCVPEFDPMELVRVRLVFRLMPSTAGGSALDVGCGDGYLCQQLRARGFRNVVGVDLAHSRLTYARGRSERGHFSQSDVYALPFGDGQFDVVTCVEVLEHLKEPKRAMRELARVSRRYVICTTPYRESLQANLCPYCQRTFPPAGHLQRFDESRFGEMGQAAGLRLRRWKHSHPMLEYRRFRYCPPLRWLISGYYRDSGFIGGRFEKVG